MKILVFLFSIMSLTVIDSFGQIFYPLMGLNPETFAMAKTDIFERYNFTISSMHYSINELNINNRNMGLIEKDTVIIYNETKIGENVDTVVSFDSVYGKARTMIRIYENKSREKYRVNRSISQNDSMTFNYYKDSIITNDYWNGELISQSKYYYIDNILNKNIITSPKYGITHISYFVYTIPELKKRMRVFNLEQIECEINFIYKDTISNAIFEKHFNNRGNNYPFKECVYSLDKGNKLISLTEMIDGKFSLSHAFNYSENKLTNSVEFFSSGEILVSIYKYH